MDIDTVKKDVFEASNFLKRFGNEDRLLLLFHLLDGEYSVGELEELTCIQQPTLSQQLGVLRNDRMVDTRREGKRIYYSLNDPRVDVLLQCVQELFSKKKNDD